MDKNSSVLNITKEKFRQEEHVVAICESYQIIGSEYRNRLLALVKSNESYAIFSFSASKWPPESFADITVETIFPIDDNFRLDANTTSTISQYQFKLSTFDNQSIFYYYPCHSPMFKQFDLFEEDIRLAESVKLNQPHLFNWLKAYQREDFLAIDPRIADGSVTLKNRESKFREELEKREHEYIVYKGFRIFTATWNVNGKRSNDICLDDWLSAPKEPPPDIYAVAFQELDLSTIAMATGESKPDYVWVQKVKDGLHKGANYEEITSVRFVGMMLIVLVRQELRKNVIRYSTNYVGTGQYLNLGNKGGVGISMQLNESLLCFVNSHFAAHVGEVERRKEDHDAIVLKMQFVHGIKRLSIAEHNHIFWIGDLNYRLTQTPVNYQKGNDYLNWLEFDQLIAEMIRKRVFNGYSEGKIGFRPSYKYDVGSDNFDTSEKKRPPAWCDRILWKGERIRQLSYNSVMQLQMSDHKPVYATFLTELKTKDEQKYKRVHEDVLKRVDKYENDNQPQISVEKTDIDFAEIKFNEMYTRDFTVANNCHLPVHFEFRGKGGDGSKICENWLQVEPTKGELITGDSFSIRIKLFIDSHNAWDMHRKQKTESSDRVPLDILVLHVENGRDIFITIFGEYRPSCVGFSMETLARLPCPVNELSLMELMKIENSIGNNGYNNLSRVGVPHEVYLLVDYLYKNGLQTPHLFSEDRKYRKNPNINEIRDCLDNWDAKEFSGTPHTVAETLLMLLEASPEPLVSPLQDECLYQNTFNECRDLIQILSSPKKNIFIYICLFLRELLSHSSTNRLEFAKIAELFGKIMLRGHGTGTTQTPYRVLSEREKDQRRTAFMMKFLRNNLSEFRNELTNFP